MLCSPGCVADCKVTPPPCGSVLADAQRQQGQIQHLRYPAALLRRQLHPQLLLQTCHHKQRRRSPVSCLKPRTAPASKISGHLGSFGCWIQKAGWPQSGQWRARSKQVQLRLRLVHHLPPLQQRRPPQAPATGMVVTLQIKIEVQHSRTDTWQIGALLLDDVMRMSTIHPQPACARVHASHAPIPTPC